MYSPSLLIYAFAVFALIFSSAPGCLAEELKKVSFIPQWVPQSQFAGYYVALDKGMYRSAGLDVTIITGGPTHPASKLIAAGEADFGSLFLSDGIVKRSQGTKFLNIAQLIQRSSLMLIARKSQGIVSPADLDNRKIGLWGPEFQTQPRAFFKKFDLDVEIVPQSVSVNLFLRGGVDAVSAMWHNEYHTIINSGIDPEELTTFFYDQYGLNFPEDGIYCLEETFRRDPQKACRFARASLEGWRYSFEHEEEALDIIMKYVKSANVATNRVHQKWMLERMRDLMLPSKSEFGVLAEADYLRVAAELQHGGVVAEFPAYTDFFRRCVDAAE